MKQKKMSLLDALTLLKQKRPIVYPNKGFFTQLIKLDHQLSGSEESFPIELLELHQEM
jgi:hypothetical protein